MNLLDIEKKEANRTYVDKEEGLTLTSQEQENSLQAPFDKEPPVQGSELHEEPQTDEAAESHEAPQNSDTPPQTPEQEPEDTLPEEFSHTPEGEKPAEETQFSEDAPENTPQPENTEISLPIQEISDSPGNVAPNSPQTDETSQPSEIHQEVQQETHQDELAHVDFDLLDVEGRWLIKVLSGPNSGAEFSVQSGTSYLIGSDATTCDIVFQDLSVSRQHARLSIDTKNRSFIEDLGSKNGSLIDGEKLTQKRQVLGTSLITLGTTSFILIDKEGERKTLITPTLQVAPITQGSGAVESAKLEASSVMEAKERAKNAEEEESSQLGAIQNAVLAPLQSEVGKIKEEEKRQAKAAHAISSLAILAVISGIILVIGIGTTLLFHTEEIEQPHSANAETLIGKALADYPTVRYSYNPSNNKLLIVGHVLTVVDRSKLLDNLQQLKFLSSIDSSNVVIDEFVWRENNQVLSKNPAWKGITISSPSAGKFVVSGFLKTRAQADELYDYLSQNFTYVDLLEKRVVVEEDLLAQVNKTLADSGFRSVTPAFSFGELTLKGVIGSNAQEKFDEVLTSLKAIPGVRSVLNNVVSSAQQEAVINISQKYPITGYSMKDGSITVVINGKIFAKGDTIDGMQITTITTNAVYLNKDGVKYKIDFNR